jgi:GH15 family glucan-1,4-alpha-glucosidase
MNRIGDYAVVGDCSSAALIGRDGSVDWACFPRFDSPSVFARALDAAHGGSFDVRPTAVRGVHRAYVEGTNVLDTTFDCEGGTLVLTDCMPARGAGRDPAHIESAHCLLRRLRCERGAVDVDVSVAPRFDYARFVPFFRIISEETAEAVGGADALRIAATRSLTEDSDRIRARWHLREGEDVWIRAAWAPSHERPVFDAPSPAEFARVLDDTIEWWRSWSARCRVPGRAVLRSALVCKALTYGPTGAVVAAPTTSLPEALGGERNWDYRYTWIRDATLTLISLFALGVREEADAFKFWLERTSAGRPQDLQIMYGIGGERFLPELELDHLAGHAGSAPVRIGNGAAKQRQLDVYGQLVQSAYLFAKAGGTITPENWNFLSGLADIVAEDWRSPDQGIWEIRDTPRHFVHSKLNCWAALDRMVRIAQARRLPTPVARWARERDEIRSYLMEDAERRGWFSQAAGTDAPDASALLVPAMGFLPTTHPLVQKTIEVVRAELASGALVRRYDGADGLPGDEGAFLLCSWWLCDCLTHSGRIDEAESVYEAVCGFANDVGLWAEEVDPSGGEALGNFPQAFTHMAHITSCLHLEAARAGLIDYDAANDYAEGAVDRLVASGRRLAAAGASTES